MRTVKGAIKNPQRGAALVIVLWAVSLLALLAVSLGFQAWVEAKLTVFQLDRSRERRACLAAVELAKNLTFPYSGDPGLIHELELEEGGLKVFYRTEPEEGRINLNRAPLSVLVRIPGVTEEIAAAIADWRDADSISLAGGAEDPDYRSLRFPYSCKNASFESLPELWMVRGLTSEAYSALSRIATVWGEGGTDVHGASREVLFILGLGESLSQKILNYRSGLDGVDGTEDDRRFPSVSEIKPELERAAGLAAKEKELLESALAAKLLAVKSEHCRVHVQVSNGKDRTCSYELVLKPDSARKEWKIKDCLKLS